jgi:hypothetical protein
MVPVRITFFLCKSSCIVPGGWLGSGIVLEASIPVRRKTSKSRDHDSRPWTRKKKSSTEKKTVKIKKKMTGSGKRYRPKRMPPQKLNKS